MRRYACHTVLLFYPPRKHYPEFTPMTFPRFSRMAVALAVIASLAGTAALAMPPDMPMPIGGPGGHMHGPWDGHGDEMLGLFQSLHLTDAQKAQIKTILTGKHEEGAANFKALRELHEQIHAKLLTAGTTDADFTPLLSRAAALEQTMMQAHLHIMLAVRNVLTAPQLAELAAKMHKLSALHDQERQVIGQ
jgi:Spy/CpxP family protein refolding chaperone